MKKVSKWILSIFGVSAALIGAFEINKNRSVTVNVPNPLGPAFAVTIAQKEKEKLESFFRKVILKDDFGYTLLGEKPVSLSSYREVVFPISLGQLYSALTPENIEIKNGWKTWLNYSHLFKNSKYSIWSEESPWIDNGIVILLVNNQSLDTIINEHADDFKDVLKRNAINVNGLLKEAKTTPLLKGVLMAHEGLIGTVLGYGRNNAWLFEKNLKEKNIPLSRAWSEEIEQFMCERISNKPVLSKKIISISNYLFYPQFQADPTSLETKKLKEEYLFTRKLIIDYYEGKDFLETTLSLLKYGPQETFPETPEH